MKQKVIVVITCSKCGKEFTRKTSTPEKVDRRCNSCEMERLENKLKLYPDYLIWIGMIRRCDQIDNINYGGRGITVCNRWLESYDNFTHDMGPRPSKLHTLDRINNDGNYEPTNCRWADKATQNRNTRYNVNITAFGKTQCLLDWATEYNIHYTMIQRRMKNTDWEIEKIISTPPNAETKRDYHGRVISAKESDVYDGTTIPWKKTTD